MKDRYKHNMLLKEIGKEGQQKLLNSHVLCVGCGGLGSVILPYLAASGVGNITIIDNDIIDITNLQRQITYNTNDVGESKTTVMHNFLQKLNPEINIISLNHKIDDVLDASKYDIIVDAVDNIETKLLLNEISIKYAKPLVYGSVSGSNGFVGIFNKTKDSACLSCFLMCFHGSGESCEISGVFGPLVGVIGSIQAINVIKLLLSIHVSETVQYFDIKNNGFLEFDIKQQQRCLCHKLPIKLKQTYTVPDHAILIDLRDRNIYEQKHIQNAVNIPYIEFLKNSEVVKNLTKDKTIVLYCTNSARSKAVANRLIMNGFPNVLWLETTS